MKLKGGVETRTQRAERLAREALETPEQRQARIRRDFEEDRANARQERVTRELQALNLLGQANATALPDDEAGPSQPSQPRTHAPKTKKRTIVSITSEECSEWLQNPKIHPITKKEIDFKEVIKKVLPYCEKFSITKQNLIDAIMNASQNNETKKNVCVDFYNKFKKIRNLINNGWDITTVNPITDKKLTDEIEINYFKDKCSVYGFITLSYPVAYTVTPNDLQNASFYFITYLLHPFNGSSVYLNHFIDTVKEILIGTHPGSNVSNAITEYLNVIEGLLNSQLINEDQHNKLVELSHELKAFQSGYRIEASTSEASEYSPLHSKSKSRSPKTSGLPHLSKKKRAELLQELEKTCFHMTDFITQEDFEDMKKKKLQLIVKLGEKHGSKGKQHCYYVKGVNDLIKAAVKEGKVPKNPMTRRALTKEEIDQVHLMNRYRKTNAKRPDDLQKMDYPKFELSFTPVLHYPNYYAIIIKRKILGNVEKQLTYGYIPGDIETGDADVSSAVAIAKIQQLFDLGRLLDRSHFPNIVSRVHINKNIDYWITDRERKLRLMIDELNQS